MSIFHPNRPAQVSQIERQPMPKRPCSIGVRWPVGEASFRARRPSGPATRPRQAAALRQPGSTSAHIEHHGNLPGSPQPSGRLADARAAHPRTPPPRALHFSGRSFAGWLVSLAPEKASALRSPPAKARHTNTPGAHSKCSRIGQVRQAGKNTSPPFQPRGNSGRPTISHISQAFGAPHVDFG